jgi:hypothetical protein
LQTYSPPTSSGPSTERAREQAGEQAQKAAGQAKSAVRSQVDQRSTDVGQKVGGFASDVRSVGEQMRQQGKDRPAKLADQAADRAERLGSYLSKSDADRILGDVEDFGRRQPLAVMGLAGVAGFVASRFIKASSPERYEGRAYDAPEALWPRSHPSASTSHEFRRTALRRRASRSAGARRRTHSALRSRSPRRAVGCRPCQRRGLAARRGAGPQRHESAGSVSTDA